MSWPDWFADFCRTDADRHQVLEEALRAHGLAFDRLDLGGFRHLQVRGERPAQPAPDEVILVAHYDRVPNTPGANDNGASVLALVDYATRSGGSGRRVVFTDGEELGAGQGASAQGSYLLGLWWKRVGAVTPVVLDMTGIGDTWVLGARAPSLVRRGLGPSDPSALDASAKKRVWAKRWLSSCGSGRTVELDVPFSDDLGFLAAGLSSVQVSVLPRREALSFRRSSALVPPSWATMHGPDDGVETLWPSTRALVRQALEVLERF